MADTNPFADPNFGKDAPANPFSDPDFGKPRGIASGFGAGFESTLGSAAQAVGNKTALAGLEQWGKQAQEKAAPVGEESLPVAAARALGGLAGWAPAILGTAALLPETPEVLGASLLGRALYGATAGAASMALPAFAAKVNDYSNLRAKGVDEETANRASWADAATTLATGIVPLSLPGGLLKRAITGAASQAALGEANREVQNKILENHPELQEEFSAKNAAVNAIVGAAMGGIMGPRPEKAAIAEAKTQAQADMAAGEPTAPAPPTPRGEPNAVQEPGAGSVLQQPQGGTGEAGGERQRVEPVQQGNVAPAEAAIPAPEGNAPAAEAFPKFLTPGEIHLQNYQAKAAEAGLTPEQAEAIHPFVAKAMDPVTGFHRDTELIPTVEHALEYVKQTGNTAHFVDADIANLGGLNKHFNEEQAKSNAIYRGISDIFHEELNRAGSQDAVPVRKAGDEISAVIVGGTDKSVQDAMDRIHARVQEYVKAQGLDNIPHPKHPGDLTYNGVGLHLGQSDIIPGHTFKDIEAEAAKGIRASKEGDRNVGRTESKTSGAAAAAERPGTVQAGADEAGRGAQAAHGQESSAVAGKETVNGAQTPETVPVKTKQPQARPAAVSPFERAAQAFKHEKPTPKESLGENIPNAQAQRKAEVDALHAEANRLYEAGDREGAQRTAHRAMLKIIEGGPEYQQHLLDEQSLKAGEAFAARRTGQAANPAAREQIHAEAAKIFGSKEAADRLVVHVTDPEKQIPARALKDLQTLEAKEGRAITVAFAHDGKIYVMDKQIEAGHERAIILHEAGVHLGMEKLIGGANFDKLVNQIHEWANGNGHADDVALARKAMDSLRAGGVPEAHADQEAVAYFVQHAIEAGINPTHLEGQKQSQALVWLRKIWASMKSALRHLGINPANLKAQDVVDIAHAAAVAHAENTAKSAEAQNTMRSARQIDFQSGPRQAAQAVDSVVSKAMNLWDGLKPALQRAHLNWSQMTHIADMTENLIPRLPQWGENAVSPIRDKVDHMLASGAIAKELNHAAQKIYDQMQALAPKQKEALVQLMGKYQLAKVFPNRKLEEHTWLAPKDRPLYREAAQLYAQPGVAAAYDAARLHNQRLHDTGMASMLKSMAQIYGVPEHIWRAIDVKNGMGKEVTALLDHVKTSGDHDLQDQFNTAMGLHEAKKNESYFSLGRDGDYMVNFRVKDTPEAHAAVQKALNESGIKDKIVINPGDTHVFSMFETMNEMLAVTNQLDTIKAHLEPKIGEDHEGKPVSSPYTAGLAVEKLKALDSSAPSFIRGMLAKIDADAHLDAAQKTEQQELLRRMYIGMLPESSVSKFYARRAGTPGYSSDMARSFVKRAAAGAYFTAQHATRPEQNVAMARLREATSALGDAGSPYFDLRKQTAAVNVINELNKRTANILTPLHTPAIDTASAIGHAFYLSASPSFILQNLAQPYQLTLPYLGGRHGFRASSVAMGAAAKDVAKILKDTVQQGWQNGKWTGVLDATITVDRAEHLGQGDKDALKHLIASGRADWTQGGELTKIAEGSNRSLETALKTANSLSYYGEALNRMQTGLAAYRLEMKRSGDTAKALDYMVRAVDDTQINYASENKARAIGKHGVFGQMTPMVLAFQQFNLGVLQLLGKLSVQALRSGAPAEERMEAVKSLAGIMAATGVAAGTMGLPFAGVVMGAYNALMGSENQPVDAKTDYQNFLSDIMGHDAAQVVAHGALNYLSGADMASKLGQENVIPFTGLVSQLMDSRQPLKDRINSGALSFMGPVVNGGAGVLEGLNKIADGDTMKGLEQMSPAMTKGAIKAVDLANNGFTDSKGVKLPMEATTWDTVVQAAGFTPTKQSTQREAQAGVNAIQEGLKQRAQALEGQFVSAVEARDLDARQRVMQEAKAFMQANPGHKVDFAGALRKRAQAAAIAGVTGGVKGRPMQIPEIEQQTRFIHPS